MTHRLRVRLAQQPSLDAWINMREFYGFSHGTNQIGFYCLVVIG